MNMADQLTEEEAEELVRQLGDKKHNVYSFLNNVAKAENTVKVGNITEDELGLPEHTVRTYKELEVFCKEIIDIPILKEYFNKMAESTLSTSLSKQGFLVRSAITTKKELADVSPNKKVNKGWFKPKPNQQQQPAPTY